MEKCTIQKIITIAFKKSYCSLEKKEVKMNQKIQVLETSALKPELGIDRKQLIPKMIAELSGHGIQVFYLDGREISSKAEFLSQAAKAMHFPAYFGANWDAFDECIIDLEWCPAQGYILIYDRPDVFAASDPEQWKIALDILQSAVEYWREQNIPMDVFLLH